MRHTFTALVLACALFLTATAHSSALEDGTDGLWHEFRNTALQNLFYGSGGEQHRPRGAMWFVDEDHAGTNPKFHLRDEDGTKWTVKLGVEAKPETAATHLLWAVGYFTDDDYFVASLKVENRPAHLTRGQSLIGTDGTIKDARLERHQRAAKKIGHWKWKHNRFTGTREFNGLRVMMALMNSWDLKDENNAIYEHDSDAPRRIYVISDLGASFGTTGYSWTQARSKGNFKSYTHSRFIRKVTPKYVDFNVPTRPALIYFFHFPGLIHRLRMRWIGKHISRADAKWVGGILARLSPQQIQDAFRSAGYSPEEVEGFAKTVHERIAELNQL